MAEDLWLFGITGESTAVLDPGAWYSIVREGGCRFMAAWTKEEEKVRKQAEKERSGRGGQGRGCAWGDCSKLETFQSRVDWTNPRTP